MPRISVGMGASNADADREAALAQEGGGEQSVGISSSPSDERPDLSGSSLPGTESSPPSPAQDVESLSEQDLPASIAPSSSASSTDGSTQETGSGQPSLPDSSGQEASQPANPPTAAESTEADVEPDLEQTVAEHAGPSEEDPAAGGFLSDELSPGQQLFADAGQAYKEKDWDRTLYLLDEAVKLDPSLADDAAQARLAVEAAREQ